MTQNQPGDVADGDSHVGIFNNDKTKLPGNGVAGTNQIKNIEVGFGRHGRSFDFSESVNYRFTNQFDQTVSFEGTAGDDLFEFTPGSAYHTLTINGTDYQIDAALRTNIEARGGSGADRFVINGSKQVEQVITTTGSVLMRSEMWRFEATEGESFFVDSGGGYDRAFMYDSTLDDRIKMTQDYSRLWNDQRLTETRGYHRTYAFAVNGGEDRAYLYDSKYDDTVKMTDRNARMISRKFYSYAGTFERVYAYSLNGGSDRAQFWDSINDFDIMQATPAYARMYNEGLFYNQAARFGQVDAFAYSGGSNDRAYLVGSEGDDQLIARPATSGMAGEGFKFDIHGFERSYAFANGGNDRALLFDSKLDDRFIARPDAARMYNDQYFLNAKGYARVDGFSSSGGNDRAYFYDSEGDDVLVAHETKMRLFGDGFDNNSHGFKRAYAHAVGGGNDQGLLYDTDQADTAKLDQEIAKMYGEGYYNWLSGFDQVDARFASSNRHDRALVFGAINQEQLSVSGDQAKLIYDHASEFVYDIDAHSGDDGDDSDLSSIYEDLLSILGDV